MPGERRELIAWSDVTAAQPMAAGEIEPSEPGDVSSNPLTVAIECFVEPPQPPELRPCSSCGEFELAHREPHQLQADPELFQTGGYLKVTITDAIGERVTRKIVVPKITGFDRAQSIAG